MAADKLSTRTGSQRPSTAAFGKRRRPAFSRSTVSTRKGRKTLIRDMLNLVPMSDNKLNKPLQLLGRDTCSGGDHCAHRFRSTPSTLLSEEGVFDSGVMEVQLAHDTEK